MNEDNDIYRISGRVKNIIAKEDIALSQVGTILVNYFSLMLKDLYDFSETLPTGYGEQLRNELLKKESVPMLIIKVSTKDRFMTLYEQVMESMKNPKFKSLEDALKHYILEYDTLGKKHGMTGDEFWFRAESSEDWTEDCSRISMLSHSIKMLKHLIKKEKRK